MKDKILNYIEDVKSNPKKLIIPAVILLVVIFFINGFRSFREEQKRKELYENAEVPETPVSEDNGYEDLYDSEIINRQEDLIKKYGPLPENYLWDLDGTLLSMGDKDATAEEALWGYLNGIRTLDFSSAQKYSRGSSVVKRYEMFFDTAEAKDDVYSDNFYRNMYTEVLKSIQPKKVTDTAVFAENKQVFTVELELLDLSSKDFWEKDREDIYNTLYIYSKDEDDYTKSENYIYDYVLDYYRSPEAITRNVTVNITVEKYARLGTGWLVTIDKDIDNYCYYTDGNIVARYIMSSFQSEGRDYIRELRETGDLPDEGIGNTMDTPEETIGDTNEEVPAGDIEGDPADDEVIE